MSSSTLYKKFGYTMPADYGEVAEMCNNTYVCGEDRKWHIDNSYDGEIGKNCNNQNVLKQMCEVYESGTPACVTENNLVHCYENIKDVPDSVNSTGNIATVPEPGQGKFICGFNVTDNHHVTVFAPSCENCPSNLNGYDGQKCPIKTVSPQTTSQSAPQPIPTSTGSESGRYGCCKQNTADL